MGVNRFITLNNGQYFEPKNSFKKAQQQLAKPKFLSCIHPLLISDETTYIKSQPKSAKTTRLCTRNGGHLVMVDPKNTSRTCPMCNHISKDNRKTQSEFKCVECDFEDNADKVAAINILRAGRARLACEVNDAVRSSATGTHRSDLAQHC